MAEDTQPAVVELAKQLTDGFVALSGEYQLLFEQQRQLETKLSWAKQQVRTFSILLPSYDEHFSSRPEVAMQLCRQP